MTRDNLDLVLLIVRAIEQTNRRLCRTENLTIIDYCETLAERLAQNVIAEEVEQEMNAKEPD